MFYSEKSNKFNLGKIVESTHSLKLKTKSLSFSCDNTSKERRHFKTLSENIYFLSPFAFHF